VIVAGQFSSGETTDNKQFLKKNFWSCRNNPVRRKMEKLERRTSYEFELRGGNG
jgi:hypothetical protein